MDLPKGKRQSYLLNMRYASNDSVRANHRNRSRLNISSPGTLSVANFPDLPLFFVSSCFLGRISHFHKVWDGEIRLSPSPTPPPLATLEHCSCRAIAFASICANVFVCECVNAGHLLLKDPSTDGGSCDTNTVNELQLYCWIIWCSVTSYIPSLFALLLYVNNIYICKS